MYPDNITVSPENSIKLKEIGFYQYTYFYWRKFNNNYRLTTYESEHIIKNDHKYIAAFTAQELLTYTILSNDEYDFGIDKINDYLRVYYSPEHGTDNSYTFEGSNLADLLAKMIIAKHKEDEIENGNN